MLFIFLLRDWLLFVTATRKGWTTFVTGRERNKFSNFRWNQGWRQGRARGLQPSRRRHLAPPVGGNFRFSSEEIWQNYARKHHFSVIVAPCRKLQPLCRKISGATPGWNFSSLSMIDMKVCPSSNTAEDIFSVHRRYRKSSIKPPRGGLI